ncbi:histidinol dehydrogenase [Sporosarcina koreensis]|uniref:histidinol dehydrogenase n=1 Tax=Sporosarcina koreensis TaxID=334735 RepID=UPI00058F90BA|nr:histidinol dehydrogenase [Sporosarcina koreensis]
MRLLTDWQQIEQQLQRRTAGAPVEETVRTIISRVRANGDAELLALARQYDGADLENLQVTLQEITEAVRDVPDGLMKSLTAAKMRIQRFHDQQKEESWDFRPEPGVRLGQLIRPVEAAGIYIPGGKAAYPSTVLMNVLPAKIAGVERIVMVTPPDSEGRVHPAVLAAADLCGITEIYKVGGAQAIAALAYGTETIGPVEKITGPGNAYVACAKKLVQGDVGIDMIAGPSEVCIWADEQADPAFIAADLLAQAEHDEQATACCIVETEAFGQAVIREIGRQLEVLDRKDIAGRAIAEHGWIAVLSAEDDAIRLINRLAPEHLEIMTAEPEKRLEDIRNAGAIFIGPYSPEALGDYMAGPNHTLPTNGTAKFSSPLGVYDFTKRTSIIRYEEQALRSVADEIITLARTEQLGGHAGSIAIRTKEAGL